MNFPLEVMLLAIGIVFGYHFYIIDCLLYAFYLHPEDETSRHLREQLKQNRYWLALRMMYTMNMSPKRYIHKSVKFLIAFLAMAFFIVTSTGSALGRGFVLGFGVYVLLALVKVYKTPALLREKFFWDLSPEVKENSVQLLARIVFIFIVLVSAFALL